MRAVLFDADGVLLDSIAGYRGVWSRWAELRGLDVETVWAATFGRRTVETVAEVAPQLDADAEQIVISALQAEYGVTPDVYPGVTDLLQSLPLDAWAVVTSGERSTVVARLTAADAPAPNVVVDGSDVQYGKPAPEGYLAAAAALRVGPSECLVVEDAPAGVAAGKAAGMTVLALGTTHDQTQLSRADHYRANLIAAVPDIRGWLCER